MSDSPIYDETKYRAALGIGYENFNYVELAIGASEDNVALNDLDGNPVTARAVMFYSTVDAQYGLNRSTADYPNEPQLPAEMFLTISAQVTTVYGKASTGGTLRIYYVW